MVPFEVLFEVLTACICIFAPNDFVWSGSAQLVRT